MSFDEDRKRVWKQLGVEIIVGILLFFIPVIGRLLGTLTLLAALVTLTSLLQG